MKSTHTHARAKSAVLLALILFALTGLSAAAQFAPSHPAHETTELQSTDPQPILSPPTTGGAQIELSESQTDLRWLIRFMATVFIGGVGVVLLVMLYKTLFGGG